MTKTLFVILLTMLAVVLAACNGSGATETPPTATAPPSTSTLPSDEGQAPTATPLTAAAGQEEEDAPTPVVTQPQSMDEGAASFVTSSCPFEIPAEAEVTCGTVTVPENRLNPSNNREVVLQVAVFHSSSATPAADPVVYLSGGPGGYALELIQFTYEDSIEPFLADREYVIFDQRGTGYSQPSLACEETFELELSLLDDDLSDEEFQSRYLDALAQCRQRLLTNGVDLTAYNSAENAADVEAIRQALGYEKWNLLGVSYGTRLAQTVMRDYPAGLRSVILDSPYPLEVDLQEALPGHMTRAFRVFFDGCAADPECAEAYPDLEQVFYNLVDRLNASPIEFPIVYFLTGDRYDVVFNGDNLVDILFQALYSNEIFPLMPRVIRETNNGVTDTLALLFTTFLVNGEFISTGMYRSVQCREELAFSDLNAVERAAMTNAQLEEYFDDWRFAYDACDLWQSGQADPIENQPVASEVPALVMTGEYDPITPPAWGEVVAANLSAEYLVEFPAVGHGATSSGDCPLGVALDFLRDPSSPPDTSCVSVLAGPAFDIPGKSSYSPVIMVPFESELAGITISGLAPEGWDETLPGTFIRGGGGLDQAAVIFQAVPYGVVSSDEFVAFFFQQLSAEPDGDPEQFFDANGREWTISTGQTQGLPLLVAVSEDGFYLSAVILVTNMGEEELLRMTLLEPALDGFEIAE